MECVWNIYFVREIPRVQPDTVIGGFPFGSNQFGFPSGVTLVLPEGIIFFSGDSRMSMS